MRYFVDTEFNELGPGRPMELISIGIKADDGREYYAVCADGWRLENCSRWVKENVIPYLGNDPKKLRLQIANEITTFVGAIPYGGPPEFWGYFADYDWVLFCQLWGTMLDLPNGFPMFCMDLRQSMAERGIDKKTLPKQLGQDHNALADAQHMKVMYDFIYK